MKTLPFQNGDIITIDKVKYLAKGCDTDSCALLRTTGKKAHAWTIVLGLNGDTVYIFPAKGERMLGLDLRVEFSLDVFLDKIDYLGKPAAQGTPDRSQHNDAPPCSSEDFQNT